MRLFCLLVFSVLLAACSDSSRRPNQPPALAGAVDVTVQANVTTDLFTVTVSDDRTAAAQLVLSIESDNAELLPDAAIAVSGGTSRTVTASPTPGVLGTAVLTLTVTDAAGLSSTATATVIVDAQQVVFSDVLRSVFDDDSDAAPRDLNSLTIDNDAGEGDFDDLLP